MAYGKKSNGRLKKGFEFRRGGKVVKVKKSKRRR